MASHWLTAHQPNAGVVLAAHRRSHPAHTHHIHNSLSLLCPIPPPFIPYVSLYHVPYTFQLSASFLIRFFILSLYAQPVPVIILLAPQWPYNRSFPFLSSSMLKILSSPPCLTVPTCPSQGTNWPWLVPSFLANPLVTPYLYFIFSHPSPFPLFSSIMYPIPSIFQPLSLLHFISLSSTISHHHPLGPPMALKRAISISLFLHVQDTFSCPLAWLGPAPFPTDALAHTLFHHIIFTPLPLWSSQDCVLCDNSNIPI